MSTPITRDLAATKVASDLLTDINRRIIEFREIKASVAAGSISVGQALEATTDILSEIADREAEIKAIVEANIPEHQWLGTKLRLRNPNGGWGDYVELAVNTPGLDGRAATITIGTITIGELGSTYQVINSGTDTDAVLDFVFPPLAIDAPRYNLDLNYPQNLVYVGQVI